MKRKDIIGGVALIGILVAILLGIGLLQPKKEAQTATYELKGFPALPVSDR